EVLGLQDRLLDGERVLNARGRVVAAGVGRDGQGADDDGGGHAQGEEEAGPGHGRILALEPRESEERRGGDGEGGQLGRGPGARRGPSRSVRGREGGARVVLARALPVRRPCPAAHAGNKRGTG